MKKMFILILIVVFTFTLVSCKNCEHYGVTWEGYPATCSKTGLTDGIKCEKCGEIMKDREEIPTTDHSYGEYTSISSVKHMHKCVNCDTQEIETHKWDNGIIIETNNQTGMAKTKFTCSICHHEEIIEHKINAIVFPPVPLN